MSKAGQTHDVSFYYGGVEYGFQLYRDAQSSRKAYSRGYARLLPPQYTTESPTYDSIPPDVELNKEQKWFTKGFGQYFYEDARKYKRADGIDCCIEGRAYLSGKQVTEITTAITNGGFETGDFTGWTIVAGTVSISTVTPYAGSYCAEVGAAGAGIASTLAKDIPWSADMQGRPIAVEVALQGSSGTITAGIDDGYTTTWGATVTGSTAWALRSLSAILSSTATRCRVLFAVGLTYSGLVDSLQYGTITCDDPFASFKGDNYLARGRFLQKWGTEGWKYCALLGATITDIEPFGATLYLGQGDAAAYERWTGSATTVGAETATYFGAAGASYLVLANLPNTIKTWDGSTASWSSATTIEDTSTTITKILTHPTSIYVYKNDMCYLISGSTITPYLPPLRHERDANTGKHSLWWDNHLIIPAGSYGLYRVDTADAWESICPSNAAPGQSQYRLPIKALDGDEEWLTAIGHTGATATMFRGQYMTVAGEAGWFWQSIKDFAAGDIKGCLIHEDTVSKKLFVATGSSICYFHHPDGYNDYNADTGYKSVLTGDLELSGHDGGFRDKNKAWYGLALFSENLSANKKVEVLYGVDTSATLSAGTITASSSTLVYFPANTNGKIMNLILRATTNDEVDGPVIISYRLFGQLLDSHRATHNLIIHVGPNNTLKRTAASERIKVDDALTVLHNLVNSQYPFIFGDLHGSTAYVTCRPESYKEEVVLDAPGSQMEHLVTMQLMEADCVA